MVACRNGVRVAAIAVITEDVSDRIRRVTLGEDHMRAWIAGAGAVSMVAVLVTPAHKDPFTRSGSEQTVTYRGYSLSVPTGWPVIDLTANPAECVRFDRNAVYLGTPGADQRCAAGLRQVTDAILVEPADSGVRVTVSGDKYRALATPDTQPVKRTTTRTVQPGVYTGQGFDACAAPSQAAMDAWLGSPYRAVGVYIGGVHRACAQPNLTPKWVTTQVKKGWHLVPAYVGMQAPCTSFKYRLDLDQGIARNQGRDAANDAIGLSSALGLTGGSVIYNDMESYNTADGACSGAVMAFLSGWSDQLRDRGYRSGVYSSAGSGITDLVRNFDNRGYSRPDHVWYGWWNNQANADGGRFLPVDRWSGQRIHQFAGGHDESYYDVGINIDSNYLDLVN
jgi:glycoside hydrolase-like protein